MIHTIGMILFAIGVAMAGAAVLAFADLRTRFEATLEDRGEDGANGLSAFHFDSASNSTGVQDHG